MIKINNTKLIYGINYVQKESRSETFANDISICIRRDPRYLRRCVEFLKHFARISGLQCSLEKTAVIPIVGNYDIDDKLCPEPALSWENKFTLLGFQNETDSQTLTTIIKNASRMFMRLAGDGQGTDSL